ncbi:MAG: phage integrase N-terminal SAM-like domain-containing protein [Solirubrobacteraceae bacterium]
MQQLGDVAQAQADFERWLERQPLADRTKREYARNVRVFLEWLAASAGWDADPLADRLARDHAARDFRRWLKVERRAAASTVNLALASLDALHRQRGLGNPNVRRELPVRAAPRALSQDHQRDLLRACERASPRDPTSAMRWASRWATERPGGDRRHHGQLFDEQESYERHFQLLRPPKDTSIGSPRRSTRSCGRRAWSHARSSASASAR